MKPRSLLARLDDLEAAFVASDRAAALEGPREPFRAKVERLARTMDPADRDAARTAIAARFKSLEDFVSYLKRGMTGAIPLDHSWHPPGLALIQVLAAVLPPPEPSGAPR